MDFFAILTMVGGLALFLYGMETMGAGLSKLSGGRMERLLEKLTSKRIMAVLLGAGVTAVIQSSSATTVMVVGFVNSGIMKLTQAVGIIMGANIGTTITSWILSLSGIEGSSFFLKMLKPSSFSPILAVIGVGFLMFSKNEKKKDIGNIMVGFAVLMFGMETMSGAVAPLAQMEGFTRIFTMFSNPILGMVVGAVLTAVIQSSSASVGILQALCVTGAVSFGTALPIIMGQNIGTCITAIMSSVGASKNAKRAAAVHLYFNMIGTILFMVVFYSINAFVHFEFLNEAAAPAGIAVVHSLFNIGATIVLFPFAKGLEKLAILTIPEKAEPEVAAVSQDFARLDDRFLDKPGFAIGECRTVANSMAAHVQEAMELALSLFQNYDKAKADRVVELEDRVDKYEDALGTYMVKLSSKDLSKRESKMLSLLLHSIGDYERISDHAVNIMQAYQEMQEKKLDFSPGAKEELVVFSEAIRDIVSITTTAFVKGDQVLAREVEPLEQVVDTMNLEEKQRHIQRLTQGKCTIELGFILSDISTNFERVADHCSNIAVYLLQINEDNFDTHEFLDMIKDESNEEFKQEYQVMSDKYRLPELKDGE
ncbi:MAG: Na/Pi cotransporter family protein [Lachnospiraceae bacterium]|nr:Na/Pi cotransporter family protein [Lachnospiraceae bacterium]MDD3795898.1 Na/Pi cotransporter family protein [Lachnospiraceae bacterium]